jgi:hypothetical protein
MGTDPLPDVANRYFDLLEDLEGALIEHCGALCDQPETIRSHRG